MNQTIDNNIAPVTDPCGFISAIAHKQDKSAQNKAPPMFNWILAMITAKTELNKMCAIYDQQINSLVQLQRQVTQGTSDSMKNSLIQQADQCTQNANECTWVMAGAIVSLGIFTGTVVIGVIKASVLTNPEKGFDQIQGEMEKESRFSIPQSETEVRQLLEDPNARTALENGTFKFILEGKSVDRAIEHLTEYKNRFSKQLVPTTVTLLEQELNNPTLLNPLKYPATEELVDKARDTVKKNLSKNRNTYFEQPPANQANDFLTTFKTINTERKAYYARRQKYLDGIVQSMQTAVQSRCISNITDGTAAAIKSAGLMRIKQNQRELEITQAATQMGESMYKNSVSTEQSLLKDLIESMDAMQQDISSAQMVVG